MLHLVEKISVFWQDVKGVAIRIKLENKWSSIGDTRLLYILNILILKIVLS